MFLTLISSMSLYTPSSLILNFVSSWFHVKLHGILQRGDLQRASRFSVFNPPSLCKHHQTPTQTDTEGGLFFLYYTCFLMFYRSLNTTLPRSQAITHPGYTGETHFMTVTHLFCDWTQKKSITQRWDCGSFFFFLYLLLHASDAVFTADCKAFPVLFSQT